MLIKPSFIFKDSKARKKTFLCLSSIALSVLAGGALLPSSSAMAQSEEPIFVSPSAAGQTEIRLQQMETQIRQLTGKVEKQLYEINSLKQKISTLEKIGVQPNHGAPQNTIQHTGGRIGASVQDSSPLHNPLGLDLSAQQPKGMKTTTVIAADRDATAQYEQAYADLKNKQYSDAQKGFDKFLSAHGDHILAANAKYWLGETYYVRGDYTKAARVFAEGFQKFPDSAKSPDILLKLGMSLKGVGKSKDACIALGQIPVKFPSGNEDVLKRAEQERMSLSCDM